MSLTETGLPPEAHAMDDWRHRTQPSPAAPSKPYDPNSDPVLQRARPDQLGAGFQLPQPGSERAQSHARAAESIARQGLIVHGEPIAETTRERHTRLFEFLCRLKAERPQRFTRALMLTGNPNYTTDLMSRWEIADCETILKAYESLGQGEQWGPHGAPFVTDDLDRISPPEIPGA